MEKEILGYEVQTRLDNEWIPAVTEMVTVDGEEIEVPVDPVTEDEAKDLAEYLNKLSGHHFEYRIEPVYK